MSWVAPVFVVGGVVLAPSLLAPATPATPATPGPTIAPSAAQSAATAEWNRAVLGLTGEGTSLFARTQRLYQSLVLTRGAVGGDAPGFPALSAADMVAVTGAAVAAARAGVGVDGGYIVSTRITGGIPDQVEEFGELLAGTGAVDPRQVTKLGAAVVRVFAAERQAIFALGGGAFDPREGLRAVAELTTEMDAQGFRDPRSRPPGLGDALDSIKDATLNAPTTIKNALATAGSAVAGLFGDAAGAVLFSTPVLVLVGGVLVYQAVKS